VSPWLPFSPFDALHPSLMHHPMLGTQLGLPSYRTCWFMSPQLKFRPASRPSVQTIITITMFNVEFEAYLGPSVLDDRVSERVPGHGVVKYCRPCRPCRPDLQAYPNARPCLYHPFMSFIRRISVSLSSWPFPRRPSRRWCQRTLSFFAPYPSIPIVPTSFQ
jgi:hypothetical protein